MEEAIHSGDKIVINKIAYGLNLPFGDHQIFSWKRPKENDVVVYLMNNNYIVKRIVAVEKTPLEYSYSTQYNLIVNEKTFPLTEIQFECLKSFDKVPDGTVLAIGDNYENSIDSRDYGLVSEKNILGRVAVR